MKICSKCDELKHMSNYSRTVNGNKRADCKSCEAEYHKAYYLINKETMMANQKLRNLKKKKWKKNLSLTLDFLV